MRPRFPDQQKEILARDPVRMYRRRNAGGSNTFLAAPGYVRLMPSPVAYTEEQCEAIVSRMLEEIALHQAPMAIHSSDPDDISILTETRVVHEF